MSNYETGESDPTAERLAKLQDIMGSTVTRPLVDNFHDERIPLCDGCEPRLEQSGDSNMVVAERANGTTLTLEVKSQGLPDGWPVLACHGTGFSARGLYPRGITLSRLGVRLISWSRPGYGESPPDEGRIVADSATDADAVRRAYGIEKFSVMGRSTGGLHALACAALLPNLVVNTALFSSIAPAEYISGWSDGMSDGNRHAYGIAGSDPVTLLQELADVAQLSKTHPEALLDYIEPGMSESDQKYSKSSMRGLIADGHAYALRNGVLGWFDDILATKVLPLGFDPRQINSPVHLIQGADDKFTTTDHFEWLATNVPGAEEEPFEDVGHFGTLDLVITFLRELKREARRLSA